MSNQDANENIKAIAMNLTITEFHGYCEGMAVNYALKVSRGSKPSCDKRLVYWSSVYDKYKHLCRDGDGAINRKIEDTIERIEHIDAIDPQVLHSIHGIIELISMINERASK